MTFTAVAEPGSVFSGWQGDAKQRVARERAHGSEVGEVHGERLVANAAGVGIGEEMHALDQHVGGHRGLPAGGGVDQRGVVAHAERRVVRRPRKIAADETELIHRATAAAPSIRRDARLGPICRARH